MLDGGTPSRRSQATRVVLAALVAAMLVGTSPGAVAQVPAGPNGGTIPPGLRVDGSRLEVRGSVGQIHVLQAEVGAAITVRGPERFTASGVTDAFGGLVIRDVPPGGGYTVTVSGAATQRFPVHVLAPDDHPHRSFYERQDLDPSYGYLRTRAARRFRTRSPSPTRRSTAPVPTRS
jgi:hypothetical protein